ncbi:MAG: histidine kinase dimerization/phospho-acceptor domain-containing protein [Pyrinomonadaceae bacterium]
MTTDTEENLRDNEDAKALEKQLRAIIAGQEAKLADIAERVAHVRHEINNPLTGVLGQAQLLLREVLPETARRRAETIEQLAARIRDTVAGLRDIQSPNSDLPYDERTPLTSDYTDKK